jgi:hypothetical protein
MVGYITRCIVAEIELSDHLDEMPKEWKEAVAEKKVGVSGEHVWRHDYRAIFAVIETCVFVS